MIRVLLNPPLLFGQTWLSMPVMANICKGWAKSGGRQHFLVPTKASLARDAITGGAVLLDKAIRDGGNWDLTYVLGHSQGSQVATEWLENNNDVDPSKLKFRLCGNPQRGKAFGAKGGVKWEGKPKGDTPNDTPYEVWDIARQGDKFAQPTGTLMGDIIHMSYNNVDLDNIESTKLSKTVVGNTTYYVVP